jgi:hypothetical protein
MGLIERDPRPGEPGSDHAVPARLDHVDPSPPVEHSLPTRHEPTATKDPELAARGRPLMPSWSATTDGRRGPSARSATIRNLSGSARSAIPEPERCGMAIALHRDDRRLSGDHQPLN